VLHTSSVAMKFALIATKTASGYMLLGELAEGRSSGCCNLTSKTSTGTLNRIKSSGSCQLPALEQAIHRAANTSGCARSCGATHSSS
jgi:hypothetical protein